MQAMEIERSPGLPSLMVTTRRRLMPQGTSCSFLHAVTQALHSMQRSESHRNFKRAMVRASSRRADLAEGDLGFLHHGHRVVAVCGDGVDALAEHDRVGPGRVEAAAVLALPPSAEVEGHEGDALADALRDHRLDLDAGVVLGPGHPDPLAVAD